MTDAGAQALNSVLFGKRVTIQPVDARPYLVDGVIVADDEWQPVVLLPARAANLSAKNGLFHVPEAWLAASKLRSSCQVLTPSADCRSMH
jgi:hypothetical protein